MSSSLVSLLVFISSQLGITPGAAVGSCSLVEQPLSNNAVITSKENNPVKVEFEVGKLITRKEWTNLSQRLIWHGRRVCHSRKPACGACVLAKLCPSFGIGESDPIKAKRLVKVEADFR